MPAFLISQNKTQTKESDFYNLDSFPNNNALSFFNFLFSSSNDCISLFNDPITLSLDNSLKLCFGAIAVILLFCSFIASLLEKQ